MSRKRGSLSALVLTVVLVCYAAAGACPTCKDTIAATDLQQTGSIAGAMNLSIYCLFAGLATAFVLVGRAMRQAFRQRAAESC